MKKQYEKPTLSVIEMGKELLQIEVGSNGESGYNALSKGNNNLFMDEEEETDNDNTHKYNLWSED
ncbi:MAG: hypothetical protein ACI3Y5_04875 [Prevotella sp.]